jgi:ribosomal protein S18 acetylase RimI-like enzyme
MGKPYQITIRPATAADAAAVSVLSQRVMVATFVEEFGIAYDPRELEEFLAKSHGEARLLEKISDPQIDVWLAEIDGVLAGYASVGPMTLPHPEAKPEDRELYRLYVSHSFHGHGVGPALMDAAEPGVKWLGVWSENLRAQKFYSRYGFEKAGEYGYVVGSTIDREFIFHRPAGTLPAS